MRVAGSRSTLVAVAAALVLFSVLGAFFHQHAPVPPAPSASCSAADPDALFGHSHLLPAAGGNAGVCTICFFNRCASHGAPFAAHAQKVEFDATSVVVPSGLRHDSPPARLSAARGPPVA